ncbi:MAG: nuclear transport factor 2 family protein [Novosphingobium sp.]
MKLSGSIADRLEIQELYARYGSASSRGDREGWLACWADDAVWASHIFDCRGKAQIEKQYLEIMSAFDKLYFSSQLGPVEIDGETAKAQSQAMEIAHFKAGGFFKLAGVYEDTLARRDGDWLFIRREYQPVVQDF